MLYEPTVKASYFDLELEGQYNAEVLFITVPVALSRWIFGWFSFGTLDSDPGFQDTDSSVVPLSGSDFFVQMDVADWREISPWLLVARGHFSRLHRVRHYVNSTA